MKTIAAGVAVLLLSSVGRGAPEGQDSPLSKANAKFAFDLYAQILKANEGKNVLVSPTSISLALAMSYAGSDGKTRMAMSEVLGFKGMTSEELNTGYAALLASLKNVDPKVKLEIADSIWADRRARVKPAFAKHVRDIYAAEATTLDFASPEASKAINAWVKKNTGGKIDRMVDDRISPETLLILLNAVYFKAEWRTAFDKKLTKELPFHLADGKTRRHPMMSQEGSFRCGEAKMWKAVRLPYGKKDRTAMYVFVPNEGFTLADLHDKLTADTLATWIEDLRPAECEVLLPRFKLEFEQELNRPLIELGMEAAFGPSADFSVMLEQPVCISRVLHKTFVEVNEEGTEAAAATKIEMKELGMEEELRIAADRPFFCAIRDDTTGTLLFLGSIVDPKAP